MTISADLTRVTRYIVIGAVCLLAPSAFAQSGPDEENARRLFDSGKLFLTAQNYAAALRDFEAVLQSYPASSVADDALLAIVTHGFNTAREPAEFAAADARVKELINKYRAADATAMGYVLEGRIALRMGRGQEQMTSAMASFDRVARLFPGSDAVPASMYFAGEAARLGGRRAEAIQRFGQLATTFPNSSWTANALLGSALALTAAGQPTRAMEQLQRVRNKFGSMREATVALNWNTVLYRLYVRTPSQPTYQATGRTLPASPGRLKDATALAVDPATDALLVATKGGVAAFGPAGAPLPTLPSPEPQSIFFDRFDRLTTVHESGLRDARGAVVSLDAPMVDGRLREPKLAAGVMTASGDYLLADRGTKSILRFSPVRKFTGIYATRLDARRLAINDLDEVAALDLDTKSVLLLDRDGRQVGRIAERGPKYQLRDPIDVALDRFSHIYVLDRAAVLVFSPGGTNLLTIFPIPDKTEAGSLSVDSAGRLYVLDRRSETAQVYK